MPIPGSSQGVVEYNNYVHTYMYNMYSFLIVVGISTKYCYLLLIFPLSSSYRPIPPSLLLLYRAYLARLESKDTSIFCLQVMVGVIILYDNIHPLGAFAKKSAIDVSGDL